ncbi:30S ribosomal protein S15 [Citrus sinensis]|uniref:Small ribosomal subunit protein uS15c n=2 Tax=Citrus TaxID=2706 RepID=A0A067DVI7_CITSI|nr:rho GTPase-activating protein gacU [Citrus x clementina]XP_006465264.2 uncharacterized protein LOC102625381 [Citrus sinensis]ESR40772.1 hypothetical protein CICLE_v10025627mg [Citrus x clementina]KAH9667284.1 30S ribosomal protein S15 [Citrus sinensis]KDO45580.1 hypothetical protein CISIN_1g013758mg [Citrus sinensis]
MALHLFKPKHRSLTNPSLIHLFSTSQNDNNDNNNNYSNSSLNSYFSDVKASLRKQTPPNQTTSSSSSSSRGPPSKVASLEEIRRNLAEFRQRSTVPPPIESNSTESQSQSQTQSQSQSQHISFQELYKRNTVNETLASKPSGKPSFEAIRESLRQMRARSNNDNNNNNRGNGVKNSDPLSLKNFTNTLRMKPADDNAHRVIGGSQELPALVFGKEKKEEEKAVELERMKTDFVKMYSFEELGDKLKKLRPEGLEGGFSLRELNERLMRLRVMEMNESNSKIGAGTISALRSSLARIQIEKEEKARVQRINILEGFGGTPEYLLHPPKEHLVEKYFHPDNMSSAEKMKIELAKVREEFKMSESDCGSARVQIAQLTTKIKHLSSALHKKDKHSRKGLQAMVQRRKRLLKYLRRTDWDSYCFVLSKLGLRDNPDYKSLA